MVKWVENLNAKVDNSAVGKYFKIKERNSSFTQELRGGFVTFLTCSYILAVNANILTDTGGTCVCDDGNCECPLGPGSLGDPACIQCKEEVRRSLIAATAAACVVSHFLMGMVANLPLAVAPAMGLNAYFAYTVVGFMGTGRVSYQEALAAVLIEGLIFILISAIGLRTFLISKLPRSIMLSTSAGIGLFLAHIGLQGAEGLGIVTYEPATLVTLGGCTEEYRRNQFTFSDPFANPASVCAVNETTGDPILAPGAWVPSPNYSCKSAGVMRSPTTWLGICGGMLMAILMAKGIRGSMIIGILFVTFISWIDTDSNEACYFRGPAGETRKDFFEKVATTPDTSKTDWSYDFGGFDNGDLWVALITFLYVDFLDATGTLYSMANFLSLHIPNFVDEKTKKFERQTMAYCVDGVSIMVGSTLGLSPLTVYIESAAGIKEGARTGLSTLLVMFCFFISLFFTPLISAIPPYATGPALILVGAMMMINIVKIDWANIQDAVPAFLTIAVIPLTYSIAYGIIAGLGSYLFINFCLLAINLMQVIVFPKSVSEEAQLAGQGSKWQTAVNMTWKPDSNTVIPPSEYSAHPSKLGDDANPSS